MFEPCLHDLRHAARGLLRTRGFTATAVLTLPLGVAGTTVVFALVQGVLLRALPVREQERLILAWKESRSGRLAHFPFRSSEIQALRDDSRVLERVAGVTGRRFRSRSGVDSAPTGP